MAAVKEAEASTTHYTVTQAAKILNCSVSFMRKMLSDGRMKGFKVGNVWRIPASEVAGLFEDYEPEKRFLTALVKKGALSDKQRQLVVSGLRSASADIVSKLKGKGALDAYQANMLKSHLRKLFS